MQKPNISKMTKKDVKDEKPIENADDNDALFEMEGLDEVQSDWTDSLAPKTFAAPLLGEAECEANQAVQKISEHNDFRPIEAVVSEEAKPNGNGKKKKKTRKVSSKKKHQRKSSSSSLSSQSDRAGSEQRAQATPNPSATDINFFSDTELTAAVLR